MTFWALGKVKNITQKINLKDYKDYGSKIIKNYMPKEEADFYRNLIKSQQSQASQIQTKQVRTEEQWMIIQINEYKKLAKLQQHILLKHEQQEKQRLQHQYASLEKSLEELEQNQQAEQQYIQRQTVKSKLKKGEMKIEEIIQQNIELKEQIQKSKVHQSSSS